MNKVLDNGFYYLDNFQYVLAWIAERYSDLLTDEEARFIADFPALPQASRALFVRMAMRACLASSSKPRTNNLKLAGLFS